MCIRDRERAGEIRFTLSVQEALTMPEDDLRQEFLQMAPLMSRLYASIAVSYTHLDVYKRQTLTLHRKTGSGSSSAKSVYLCAITNTSASGTPSIARNYGAIGTIGRDLSLIHI